MKERLEKILTRTNLLIEKYNNIKAESEDLRSENERLKNELMSKKKEIESLNEQKLNAENKLKFYTLAPDNNMSKKEIKQKIDNYISEIDNCIALIEQK